jgi:hypothetical protein
MAPAIESKAGHEVASFEHDLNSCILEDAASLEDDRIIINHENAGHSGPESRPPGEQTLRVELPIIFSRDASDVLRTRGRKIFVPM